MKRMPDIEVGLPQDGLFDLGGQYIVDKGLDRKAGFVMKPRWAGGGGDPTPARRAGAFSRPDDARSGSTRQRRRRADSARAALSDVAYVRARA